MIARFKSTLNSKVVKLLDTCIAISCFLGFFSSSGLANVIPEGWESYLSRPDILSLSGSSEIKDSNWTAMKKAHFSAIAALLALYSPETHLFFLARDGEHLYDVARLVTDGTPNSTRIHSLNISRGNMRAEGIKDYLAENGITEESLLAGKKVVFIDTGFAGTIPHVVGSYFSPTAAAALKTHLVVSSNPNHPSTRAFLYHLNPQVNDRPPSTMHGTIVSYEHMPRYTDRSSRFLLIDGRHHPISPIGTSKDGAVSKEKSVNYMQDLVTEWGKPETKITFQSEHAQFERILSLIIDGSADAKNELRSNISKSGFYQALVRDALDSMRNIGLQTKLTHEHLGMAQFEDEIKKGNKKPKKFILMEKYPDWAPYLENPDDMIPKLFTDKNWQMIGNLVDADVDSEINKILIEKLFDKPLTSEKREMISAIIETGKDLTKTNLCIYGFKKGDLAQVTDLIKLYVEHANDSALMSMVHSVFSIDQARDLEEIMKLAVQKADTLTLHKFATDVLSKPHSKDMRSLLKILIDKNDEWTNKYLVTHTFSKPHSVENIDLLGKIVGSMASSDKYSFDSRVLSQPHAMAPEYKIFSEALAIEDLNSRKQFIEKRMSELPKISQVTATLSVGDKIRIEGQDLEVVEKVASGRRGIVFQVKSANGAKYALKVAKDSSDDTLKSIAAESSKAEKLQSIQILHSKILVQAKTYVLKTWIDGLSGEEVVKRFASGESHFEPAAKKVLELVEKIKSQGAYVGDFRPANLIWTGKAWVVVDSGSIQQGMTLEDAQKKWLQTDHRGPKFKRRWGLTIPLNRCIDFYR